jgi:hypothetical protein
MTETTSNSGSEVALRSMLQLKPFEFVNTLNSQKMDQQVFDDELADNVLPSYIWLFPFKSNQTASNLLIKHSEIHILHPKTIGRKFKHCQHISPFQISQRYWTKKIILGSLFSFVC